MCCRSLSFLIRHDTKTTQSARKLKLDKWHCWILIKHREWEFLIHFYNIIIFFLLFDTCTHAAIHTLALSIFSNVVNGVQRRLIGSLVCCGARKLFSTSKSHWLWLAWSVMVVSVMRKKNDYYFYYWSTRSIMMVSYTHSMNGFDFH